MATAMATTAGVASDGNLPIIVALDNWVECPVFEGFEHVCERHDQTAPYQLIERVQHATVICTSATRIPSEVIRAAPRLRLIAANGVGTDHIDTNEAAARGISVCRVPAQNTASVAEHALALYYALRRRILPMHHGLVAERRWPSHREFAFTPRTNAEETLVVVGYGALGRHVEKIARALGMRVIVAERKGAHGCRPGRVPFDQALRQGTVFVLVTPLDANTRGMIGETEFASMDRTAYVVNVGRGGVIDEAAMVRALREGRIAGAATDVFDKEPATEENSILLDPEIPNLILSPHIAWYSSATLQGTRAVVKENVEAFFRGQPQNIVVHGSRLDEQK